VFTFIFGPLPGLKKLSEIISELQFQPGMDGAT
jgi:hypothetical protein